MTNHEQWKRALAWLGDIKHLTIYDKATWKAIYEGTKEAAPCLGRIIQAGKTPDGSRGDLLIEYAAEEEPTIHIEGKAEDVKALAEAVEAYLKERQAAQ